MRFPEIQESHINQRRDGAAMGSNPDVLSATLRGVGNLVGGGGWLAQSTRAS